MKIQPDWNYWCTILFFQQLQATRVGRSADYERRKMLHSLDQVRLLRDKTWRSAEKFVLPDSLHLQEQSVQWSVAENHRQPPARDYMFSSSAPSGSVDKRSASVLTERVPETLQVTYQVVCYIGGWKQRVGHSPLWISNKYFDHKKDRHCVAIKWPNPISLAEAYRYANTYNKIFNNGQPALACRLNILPRLTPLEKWQRLRNETVLPYLRLADYEIQTIWKLCERTWLYGCDVGNTAHNRRLYPFAESRPEWYKRLFTEELKWPCICLTFRLDNIFAEQLNVSQWCV